MEDVEKGLHQAGEIELGPWSVNNALFPMAVSASYKRAR